MEHGIIVEGVWKKFHMGEVHDSLRDLIPALTKRIVGQGSKKNELQKGDFWALQDISFTVKPGKALGIIGSNGAGKSTLLKLLNRILRPNLGKIEILGRVGALIEIAAGFHPDLTGRENVYLQGAIMGMKQAEIAKKFDEIVGFSGIEEFIDTPVKRYSSGMNARLGFSIAAHLDPEILLIDEVLSVGDYRFQQKAFDRLQEVVHSGIPVVIVSHQLDRIATLCDEAILLSKGRIIAQGPPGECITQYFRGNTQRRLMTTQNEIRLGATSVEPEGSINSGERVEFKVPVFFTSTTNPINHSITLTIRSGQAGTNIYTIGTGIANIQLPAAEEFTVLFSIQLNVPPGTYFAETLLWEKGNPESIDAGIPLYLQVTKGSPFNGSVQMNGAIEILPE